MAHKGKPRGGDTYGPGGARVRGSSTSANAAANAQVSKDAQYAIILRVLQQRGLTGANGDEVEMLGPILHQSIGPRLRELNAKARITRLTEKRKTRSNRGAHVYVLPEFVRERPTIPYVEYRLIRKNDLAEALLSVGIPLTLLDAVWEIL